MSQEKVDAYKKEKKGRKARLAKMKRNQKIAKIVSLVLLLAIVSFAGWRVYASKHPAEVVNTEVSEEGVSAAETTNAGASVTEATGEDENTEVSEEAADSEVEESSESND